MTAGYRIVFFSLVSLVSTGAAAKPHYLDRYDPVAVWTLDQSPGPVDKAARTG